MGRRPGQLTAQFTSPDFTCWCKVNSPYYVGGIYGVAFAPDRETLLCCGMGAMTDPMAGNGKMTWQRRAWRQTPPKVTGEIREGQFGSGLMETLVHHPNGRSFLMAVRQA